MPQRATLVLFAVGLAVGIGGALYFRTASAPPSGPSPSASAPEEARRIEPEMAPPVDPANQGEREDRIRATRLPSRIDYPIQSKYGGAPMSPIPHQVIAAYDEAGGGAVVGERRRFILVAPASASRETLRVLLNDVRKLHADALALRVEIFDSVAAATHPVQAGVGRDPHLVVAFTRNEDEQHLEVEGERVPL